MIGAAAIRATARLGLALARIIGRLGLAATPYLARLGRVMNTWALRISAIKPKGAGVTASAIVVLAGLGYGAVKGEHIPALIETLRDARDAAANAAGFGIANVAIAGRSQLGEAEILAAAGVTPRTSLLFLDVDAARRALEATPWIAQATVRKLYPGQLDIVIEERQAFALWQSGGKLSVIAADGTVLGPHGERKVPPLPQVVGPGAAPKAREILALVEQYPTIKEQFRAAIRVADRRWNLRLKNGLDIRLPETETAQALDKLVALDREKKLTSRDLTSIDLRLPDRVTVRLSDEAAQAREQAEKDKKKAKAKEGGKA